MEFLILLLIVVGLPLLYSLFRLIQRKRNYRRAMEHWNKLQRRIEDEDNGYVD